MMIPNLSRPVIRPALFEITFVKILNIEWVVASGANPNPNDPQRFLPVACNDMCYLFSGFSLAACLAGCRR
jgi:hypothetical protein